MSAERTKSGKRSQDDKVNIYASRFLQALEMHLFISALFIPIPHNSSLQLYLSQCFRSISIHGVFSTGRSTSFLIPYASLRSSSQVE